MKKCNCIKYLKLVEPSCGVARACRARIPGCESDRLCQGCQGLRAVYRNDYGGYRIHGEREGMSDEGGEDGVIVIVEGVPAYGVCVLRAAGKSPALAGGKETGGRVVVPMHGYEIKTLKVYF